MQFIADDSDHYFFVLYVGADQNLQAKSMKLLDALMEDLGHWQLFLYITWSVLSSNLQWLYDN